MHALSAPPFERTRALLSRLLVPGLAAVGLGALAPASPLWPHAGDAALAPTRAPAEELEEVLGRVREAVGYKAIRSIAEGLQCTGEAEYAGLPGKLRLLFEPRGSFLFEITAELPMTVGHDGKTTWRRDHTGVQRVLELEEADTWRMVMWVLSGHWLHESRPLDCSLIEAPTPGAPVQVMLELAGAPLEMTLEIDPETWRPSSLSYDDGAGGTTWSFRDYRPALGAHLPHEVVMREADTLDHSFRVGAVERAPHFFRSPYTPVPAKLGGATFDAAATAILETERVATGHLIVHPLVEGKDVGWFIFDTGAGGMCIDPGVADDLELPSLGEVVAVGVAGKTTASFRKGTRLELGPMTLEDPVYIVLDLSFLTPVFGVEVAGIVGYDLFARSVVEIETASGTLALHDPERYELAGTSWRELLLDSNVPCVTASFEGDRSGVFRIDTGAPGTVSFHAPAVKELGLLEGRKLGRSMTGGVGGSAAARTGKLDWFDLAGQRFEKPSVTFAQTEIGAFADRYSTGNIGQDFLKPFRMVLDYPHKRIAFVPL